MDAIASSIRLSIPFWGFAQETPKKSKTGSHSHAQSGGKLGHGHGRRTPVMLFDVSTSYTPVTNQDIDQPQLVAELSR